MESIIPLRMNSFSLRLRKVSKVRRFPYGAPALGSLFGESSKNLHSSPIRLETQEVSFFLDSLAISLQQSLS